MIAPRVPVIFPWFGPHPEKADLPAHGLVRTRGWDLEDVSEDAEGTVRTVWAICDNEETRAIWPHSFRVRMIVEVAEALHMVLEVQNTSAQEFTFEEALHTYFTVSDSRDVTV